MESFYRAAVTQGSEAGERFGVELEAWQVLSSGQALIQLLQTEYPHISKVYLIGEAGLVGILTQAGYQISEQDAQAVIVSLDRELTYDKLRTANRLVRQGAALIATNSDPSIPTPGGLEPGAGAILAAVESAAGVQAAIAGKPNPQVYQLAMQRLGTSARETLVVGDRLETDISGAQSLGCRTALVLSGVTSADAAQTWSPAPDLIAQDLGQLLELIQQD